MKKIFYSLAIAASAMLVGCDSLDLAPIDYAAAGNYWKNEAQVKTFANGLSTNLRADFNNFSHVVLGETRGGTFRDGSSSTGVSLNYAIMVTNSLTKDKTGVSNWNGYYSRILQVNHMIDKVENGCEFLSEEQRGSYLGLAYAHRAYYYFMLYRTYGGVPLELTPKVAEGVTDINALYMARSTPEETLAQIKDDINKSESYYAKSNDSFKCTNWNKYATACLKAEIYLWSAKVTTGNHTATGASDIAVAKAALQTVVSSGKFSLMKNYADIFDYDHKKNSEAIFELPFNKDELSMSNANFFVPQASLLYGSYYYEDGSKVENDDLGLCGGGYGRIEFREDFVKSMDKTDARRSDMFVEYYNGPVAEEAEFGCAMMKFMGHIENGTRYYDGDMFVYRYADVLLMLAECENYGGGDVAQYINMIRERAYGENFDETVAYKNGDFAANELAILQERTKEFFGEGKRWFDLVRLQDASHKSLAYSAAASYNGTPIITNQPILWPIDTGVLSGDKLIEQTPGY